MWSGRQPPKQRQVASKALLVPECIQQVKHAATGAYDWRLTALCACGLAPALSGRRLHSCCTFCMPAGAFLSTAAAAGASSLAAAWSAAATACAGVCWGDGSRRAAVLSCWCECCCCWLLTSAAGGSGELHCCRGHHPVHCALGACRTDAHDLAAHDRLEQKQDTQMHRGLVGLVGSCVPAGRGCSTLCGVLQAGPARLRLVGWTDQ